MSIAGPRTRSSPALVAGAALVAVDPAARLVSATCWESSRLLGDESRAVVERAIGASADSVPRHDLYDVAAAALTPHRSDPAVLDLAVRIDAEIRLLFHRSAAAPADVPAFVSDAPLRVVIPYRATADSPGRRDNLVAVLQALRAQSIGRERFTVVVVEQAMRTTIPEAVRGSIDNLVTIADDGAFSKSRAMNAGAAGATDAELLCLLDGDILPDEGFLARGFGRLAGDSAALHLPYTDMHCLLPADSARLRAGERPGSVPLNGWIITHPPGGCVFLSALLFRAVGGFDERFVGWGGEDRDLVDRVQEVAAIRRHPEILLHLDHERPSMRSDRDEIMSVLQGERR